MWIKEPNIKQKHTTKTFNKEQNIKQKHKAEKYETTNRMLNITRRIQSHNLESINDENRSAVSRGRHEPFPSR
jgi:hypothetical protein